MLCHHGILNCSEIYNTLIICGTITQAVFRNLAGNLGIDNTLHDISGDLPEDCIGEELILSNISVESIRSQELDASETPVMQRGLTATSSTMAMIASMLMLDVVQLWKVDSDGRDHVCVYVYVADSTLRWDPDITYTYNYYPSDGRKDKRAPTV